MKTKSTNHARRAKLNVTPDERDFAGLDAWARNLRLEDGRSLTAMGRREEAMARSRGQRTQERPWRRCSREARFYCRRSGEGSRLFADRRFEQDPKGCG